MPELPEVENVRQGLERLVSGRQILNVTVLWDNLIHQPKVELFTQRLQGQQIKHIRRRGKYLIFDLSSAVLISHLRMEGKYLILAPEDALDPYMHVIFELDSAERLIYHDVRKFGRFDLLDKKDEEAFFKDKQLGPEPDESAFKRSEMHCQLNRRKKAIKSVLLDQHLVAGIGNIYADEILYRSWIHPQTPANQLTLSQEELLYDQIIQVMEEAVQAGGTTIRTYKNAFGSAGTYQTKLQVYGRAGEACWRCGRIIQKIKVGGRGTHYCPHCQSLKETR